jgi:hypothetical protein
MGYAFAHHNGKIRPRAGHGEQMNQCHGKKFCPVHPQLPLKTLIG